MFLCDYITQNDIKVLTIFVRIILRIWIIHTKNIAKYLWYNSGHKHRQQRKTQPKDCQKYSYVSRRTQPTYELLILMNILLNV